MSFPTQATVNQGRWSRPLQPKHAPSAFPTSQVTFTPESSEGSDCFYDPTMRRTTLRKASLGVDQAMTGKRVPTDNEKIVLNGVKYVRIVEDQSNIAIVDASDLDSIASSNTDRLNTITPGKNTKETLASSFMFTRADTTPVIMVTSANVSHQAKSKASFNTNAEGLSKDTDYHPSRSPDDIISRIHEDSDFPRQTVEVIVGAGLIRHSFSIHLPIARLLFNHGDLAEMKNDAEQDQPVWIRRDLNGFGMLLSFLYSQFYCRHIMPPPTGYDGKHQPCFAILEMYQTASYFKLENVKQEILSHLSERVHDRSTCDWVDDARKIYSSDILDDEFRQFFKSTLLRKSLKLTLTDEKVVKSAGMPKAHESGKRFKAKLCEVAANGGEMAHDITVVLLEQCTLAPVPDPKMAEKLLSKERHQDRSTAGHSLGPRLYGIPSPSARHRAMSSVSDDGVCWAKISRTPGWGSEPQFHSVPASTQSVPASMAHRSRDYRLDSEAGGDTNDCANDWNSARVYGGEDWGPVSTQDGSGTETELPYPLHSPTLGSLQAEIKSYPSADSSGTWQEQLISDGVCLQHGSQQELPYATEPVGPQYYEPSASPATTAYNPTDHSFNSELGADHTSTSFRASQSNRSRAKQSWGWTGTGSSMTPSMATRTADTKNTSSEAAGRHERTSIDWW